MTGDRRKNLRSPATVRAQAALITEAVAAGRSPHFTLDRARLNDAVAAVEWATRRDYPNLKVPLHSRWRHFVVAGVDRAPAAIGTAGEPLEEARRRIDLAVTSVLLDAGAGPDWGWREPASGAVFNRSEGLALASLAAFESGQFANGDAPEVNGAALADLSAGGFADTFQVSDRNPLAGFDARLDLLRRLGRQLLARPAFFGVAARPGHLVDLLLSRSERRIAAPDLLGIVLEGFGPLWGYGPEIDGEKMGDVWPSELLADTEEPLIPFHKLAQWLTYSLVEPLAAADIEVTDLDGLTGLPEYRNGGLFIDTGVIVPSPEVCAGTHAAGSQVVVTWRALTVTLLDIVATDLRRNLGLTAAELPLGAVLQGGTWQAGRELARAKRPDGGPPLAVEAGGLVF